jgi:hypothetical protein
MMLGSYPGIFMVFAIAAMETPRLSESKICCLSSGKFFVFAKFGDNEEFIFGHFAFCAGVTARIVRTSNVGVKVGTVGKGVMDAVCVWLGGDVIVSVGIRDGVAVVLSTIGTGRI